MKWEIKIKRDGLWPLPWTWTVIRDGDGGFAMRRGDALTKDRARRRALRAKRSMETEDVVVTY